MSNQTGPASVPYVPVTGDGDRGYDSPRPQDAQQEARSEHHRLEKERREKEYEREEAARQDILRGGPFDRFAKAIAKAAAIKNQVYRDLADLPAAEALTTSAAVEPVLSKVSALLTRLYEGEAAITDFESLFFSPYHPGAHPNLRFAPYLEGIQESYKKRWDELKAAEQKAAAEEAARLARAQKFKVWREGLPDALARMEQGEIVPGYESAFGALLTADEQDALAEAAQKEVIR